MSARARRGAVVVLSVAALLVVLVTLGERGRERAPARPLTSLERAETPRSPPAPRSARREPVAVVGAAPAAGDEVLDTTPLPHVPAGGLRIEARHADDTPAFGARWILYGADRALLAEGVLADDGGAETDAHLGSGHLMLLGVSDDAQRFELPELHGLQRVTLSAGSIARGRVLVDGEPPGRPFPLSTYGGSTGEWTPGEFPRANPGVALPGEPFSRMDGGFFTDAEGRFVLSGLTSGHRLWIMPPAGFEVVEAESTRWPPLVAPEEIVISLRSAHRLRGRLLDPWGRPATTARVRVRLQSALFDPKRPLRSYVPHEPGDIAEAEVDGEARFAIPLGTLVVGRPYSAPPEILTQRLDLFAVDADGASLELSLETLEQERDQDLGDLQLIPALRQAVHVTDARGVPVGGATLRTGWQPKSGGGHATATTDAAGFASVDLRRAFRRLASVEAPGLRAQLLELPESPASIPIEVVLQPATRVRLRLLGPWVSGAGDEEWSFRYQIDGERPQHHLFRIASERDAAWLSGGDLPTIDHAARELLWGIAGSPQSDVVSPHAEFEFADLREGVPFTFRAGAEKLPRSPLSAPYTWLWESTLTLEAGELREIDVDLSERFAPR